MKKILASLLLICTATSFSFAESDCLANSILKGCADAGVKSSNIQDCMEHTKLLSRLLIISGASPDIVKQRTKVCFITCKKAQDEPDRVYKLIDKAFPCNE